MTQDVSSVSLPVWSVGDFLRKAREFADLDQQELAHELGISRNTVANYERGKVKPRKAVMMAWAMRTGVPFEWLTNGENPRPGDPDGGSAADPALCARRDSNPQPSDP